MQSCGQKVGFQREKERFDMTYLPDGPHACEKRGSETPPNLPKMRLCGSFKSERTLLIHASLNAGVGAGDLLPVMEYSRTEVNCGRGNS